MPPREPTLIDNVKLWYAGLPPVTKAIITLDSVLACAPAIGVIHPATLILEYSQVTKKLQLWRLVSCFFVNQVDIGFIMNAYFILYQSSLQLENEVFSGRTADYVYYHLVTSAVQLVAARYFGLIRLTDGLSFSIITLWSQNYKDNQVSVMGVFRTRAEYLPIFLVAFNFLTSGISMASITGIGAAYLYYYLTETYPNQGGQRYLNTPQFLQRIFPPIAPIRRGFGAQPPRQQPAASIFGHPWGRGRRLGSS